MAELPVCRLEQLAVFTSTQARTHGLTRHAVQWLLEKRALVALRRGVFVDGQLYVAMSPIERSKARAVAACLLRPGSAISHHSAALMHELPMLGARPVELALTVPATSNQRGERSRDLRIYAAELPTWHVSSRGAWAVTSVARTVCDLARHHPAVDALVALDGALSRRLTTLDAVRKVRDECGSWPGGLRMHLVVARAVEGSESPYETVARWQLVTRGYRVTPQVWAFDERGPIGCGDLWQPDLWCFLEVDGDIKYVGTGDLSPLLSEKRRQERLERAGFGVARASTRETLKGGSLAEEIDRAAVRGRIARMASSRATGYVGPPPEWARRGTVIEYAYPPNP